MESRPSLRPLAPVLACLAVAWGASGILIVAQLL
jgi:hypothetical protein